VKFSAFVEKWKFDCRTNISPSWCKVQDTLLDLHILPLLKDKRLDKIDSALISKVLEVSKAKGHSAKTRLHIYTVLFSLFDNASTFYRMMIPNPVLKRFHRPKVPKKKAAFMTPLQTATLLEYVMHTRYGPAIWCMALCALRVSEAIPRTWGDFDWVNDQIAVRSIYERNNGIQEYTKNGSQVFIPIPERLKKYLLIKRGDEDAYILQNQNGEMLDYYNFRRYFRKVCEKLKLPIRSVHGLRHSCTEIWVNAGATAEDLRRLLNHTGLDSVENYIHRTNDRLSALAKKIT
jgi:integrase